MTEFPTGLVAYRDQLHTAIERDVHRRSRVRRIAIPAAAVVAVVAAAVATTSTLGGSAQSADAAILHRISVALTPPAGTILHERAFVTDGNQSTTFELWAQADSPYAYRVSKWGYEGSFNGSSYENYDASSNTISVGSTNTRGGPTDVAATLRALVQSGQARVDETTTYDGVTAYKLTVTGSSDRFLNGTAYVAQSDYHPLLIDTGTETIRYSTYEYLAANSTNMKLLDLRTAHPSARLISSP